MIIKVNCAYKRLVPIEDIKPNPGNPNTHPETQVERLANNIKTLGWRLPITVSNLSGFIVRGHARLMAAQRLKLKRCPVDYQDYENAELEWADLIADNHIAELAESHEPEEAADCLILLCHHAHQCGYDLTEETLKKFEIIKDREWGEPDKDGVIEHIKKD